MTIVNRVTRLFKADMHGILDQLEEPEVVLRQAIRDMEEELATDDQRAKREKEQLEQLKKKRERLDQRMADYEGQLETCMNSGKDDLAKSVIRKKLEDEKLLMAFADRIGETEEQIAQTEKSLAARKDQLAAIRQKAELLAPLKPAETSGDEWRHRLDVTDDEVELALLRERERRGSRKTSPKGGAS